MTSARLPLALDGGGLILPEGGIVAVMAPRSSSDLSALPKDRCRVITGVYPDFTHFKSAGYDCTVVPEGRFAATLVCLPRARAQAQALIAQAVAMTDGPVIVDGQKDDGVDSMLKACKGRVTVSGSLSKAHGKIFWFENGTGAFDDWQAAPARTGDGWMTAPGVFSADAVDPASVLLANALESETLSGNVADLGAGWGYLSARLLQAMPKIKRLDLVEADHAALDCARVNVTDERADFHWGDALTWRPKTLLDAVVMNPPFHTGRSADPDLGRSFIRAAAGMMTPGGRLFLVANRHLGYENTMEELFRQVKELGGTGSFKLLCGDGLRTRAAAGKTKSGAARRPGRS